MRATVDCPCTLPMQLSIIIATYNAARTLESALASCVAQRFDACEIIVVDGGSRDGTVDVIRKFQDRLAYWHSRPDRGIYDAWNQALAVARGEYVCFLGADDRWADPDAVAALFLAAAGQRYDLISSQGQLIDRAGVAGRVLGTAWDYHRFGRRSLVCHPGMLHRRALFERHGIFDARYRIAGDLDWLLRLPPETQALHCERVSVLVGDEGVSRARILQRFREQREALRHCPRFGVIRAYLTWFDKLWRYPIARLLGLPI